MSQTRISYTEAVSSLLAGKPLTWGTFDEHKGGSIVLATSGQRRLLAFLLTQDSARVVARGDEQLFPGLISAWNNDDADPATDSTNAMIDPTEDVWRLNRIEASGFGGLTLFGGPAFELSVDKKNWCLNGQNGSGKTSIVSAIIWALTGKRIREQDGLNDDQGRRSIVTDATGKMVGTWPSIAAYPSTAADLSKPVEVWVRLTFVSQEGEIATAFRRLVSPLHGDPTIEASVDPRLLVAPELLETGLLMPARLARIGFGERSSSLYEAVKMLSGLDQLAYIAEGCAQIGHRGRRFLRYGKDSGIEHLVLRFSEEMTKAVEIANDLSFDLPKDRALGGKTLVPGLTTAGNNASTEAGACLKTLEAEIAPAVDTATPEGRTIIRNAMGSARAIVNQGARGIALFEAWAALKAAKDDPNLPKLQERIDQSRTKLARALFWHDKQTGDQKFRLKALAAQFYVPSHEHTGTTRCPLCSASLTTTEQEALATQLADLRKDGFEAERKLDDVCRRLEGELLELLPTGLKQRWHLLETMEPRAAYRVAVRETFCDAPPFSDVLLGLATRIGAKVTQQMAALPAFSFDAFEVSTDEPDSAIAFRQSLHNLTRLIGLIEWWSDNRDAFRAAWSELIGQEQGNGVYAEDSIEGQLRTLELALSKANPLDTLSKSLLAAAQAADEWAAIRKEQDIREAIAEALAPLKDLRLLVAADTARSIAKLSDRIKTILKRIHLKERLTYEQTSLGKKTVHVGGSFSPGLQIDAALVANTSWLRAILWAFILSLREETVQNLGANPFPLMVLDDPQTSFDPRNKRKWAEELVRLANMVNTAREAIQLFLTTHERQFYQCVVDVERLDGEQGLIGGVNKASGVVTIVNAGWLQRAWREANENNDDARARDYISDVRIYCEDLLKFMLRGEGPSIPDLSLDGLKQELKRLRKAQIAPFNRSAFHDLINTLNGGGGKPIKLINASHHKDDESIGLAEANDVKEFWEHTLMKQIHAAFAVYDRFESFYGDPRTFPWAKVVIPFPSGFREQIKALMLRKTGIAAAAKTDGQVGDGIVMIQEWEAAAAVSLPNHEVYQLAAGTLDPVAAIGDIVIVCNHAKINNRNLVIAIHEDAILARRYNEMEHHPDVAILTGQSVDPYALPEPRIIAPEAVELRKIVGTIFAAHYLPVPVKDPKAEVIPLNDWTVAQKLLKDARLLEVEGRSAEPIALTGQFLVTRSIPKMGEQVKALDGHPVVAIDEDGTRYFKRLRCQGDFAILESLNQDGTTPAVMLGFHSEKGLPTLVQAIEVIGVLFELPQG